MWLWLRRQLILLLAWGRPVLCNFHIIAVDIEERSDGATVLGLLVMVIAPNTIRSQNILQQSKIVIVPDEENR